MPAKKTIKTVAKTPRKKKDLAKEIIDATLLPAETVLQAASDVFDPDKPEEAYVSSAFAEVAQLAGEPIELDKPLTREEAIAIAEKIADKLFPAPVDVNDPNAFLNQRVKLKSQSIIGYVTAVVGTTLTVEAKGGPGTSWRDTSYQVNFRDVELAPEEK